MAGSDWLKQTKQAIVSKKYHFGKYERENYDHDNKDIDKTKSNQNQYIGCDDYDGVVDKLLKRVEEVDQKYPPLRKLPDNKRVICELIETPCPQAIYDMGRSDEFFEGLHRIEQEYFGAENVCGTMVHYDEIHPYVDKNGNEKMSLAHAHTVVAAYCEWKEPIYCTDDKGKPLYEVVTDSNGDPIVDKDGNAKMQKVQAKGADGKPLYAERKGINGKNFEKKPRYNELNKMIHAYCIETFGVPYMTGRGADHIKTEILKLESEQRKQQQVIDKNIEKISDTANAIKSNEQMIHQQRSELSEQNALFSQYKNIPDPPKREEFRTVREFRKAKREYKQKWGKGAAEIRKAMLGAAEAQRVGQANYNRAMLLEQKQTERGKKIAKRERKVENKEKNLDECYNDLNKRRYYLEEEKKEVENQRTEIEKQQQDLQIKMQQYVQKHAPQYRADAVRSFFNGLPPEYKKPLYPYAKAFLDSVNTNQNQQQKGNDRDDRTKVHDEISKE